MNTPFGPARSEFVFVGILGISLIFSGCAHMPIAKDGTWEDPVPEAVTVTEAARVERPWYGKGLAPFALTLLSGSRTGLEYNEGRDLRAAEYVRGIPWVGLLTLPYFCYESLTEKTMQGVANKRGMDDRRKQKYEAIIKRLTRDSRFQEAEYLRTNSPFEPANHPPNPAARIRKEDLDGFWNNIKILWVEMAIGHRNSLERNESRGLRKLEYWHPLILTRVWEAFEAGAGRRMADIAEKERLDERWLGDLPSHSNSDAVQERSGG